ncbi:3-isopropylmalate dehydrogenase [Saccharopolyspora erythraea NRRL 2338]|uniref:3-isopropylmalate dehydrogenase n=2 Tax=Saccharopolyspora erythraea TaxID=1836 RepID=A4FEJ6_SACEN|nr:isocitrate/isopropylmalate family dehydrogenase [Saccharopolyspora erythraea]PFG96196.1 3-isopropylmalate dehydrogenase [Saccharopolyspora erythraea NRRL 2338]CAM02471.1 3-isopropylmalate dehydrogenase [Saccharopolyspora erythraea NRRL 2338]
MNAPHALDIAVIPGDGIGPELVRSAVEVLRAAAGRDVELRFTSEDAGADAFRRTGSAMSAATLERIRTRYHGVLKGPVGLPGVRHPDGTEAGLLGGVLRGGLDTYANVRPIALLPGVDAPLRGTAVDYVIVRENTEGLYLSRGRGVGNDRACADQLLMTRHGVERVVVHAFELATRRTGAPADGVRRVTCVDKSNVLRSFAFFREVFDEVATRYPQVEADHRYADAAGHDLVADPGRFDVLVMENFLGDILSDRRRSGHVPVGQHRRGRGVLRADPRQCARHRGPGQGEPDLADPRGRDAAGAPRPPPSGPARPHRRGGGVPHRGDPAGRRITGARHRGRDPRHRRGGSRRLTRPRYGFRRHSVPPHSPGPGVFRRAEVRGDMISTGRGGWYRCRTRLPRRFRASSR